MHSMSPCSKAGKPCMRYRLAQSNSVHSSAHPIQTNPSANASAAGRRPSICSGYLVSVTRLSIAFFSALCRICPTRALSQWSVEIMVDSISGRPGSTLRSERYASLRIGAQFSACLYAGSNHLKTTSRTTRVLAAKDEDYLQSRGR